MIYSSTKFRSWREKIIDESKTMEMDALKAEGDSQAAYEDFTKNGNASIKALMQAITDKTEKKATADALRRQGISARTVHAASG